MAPERFRGEGDARADIYALGLTLYELLTLRPAFDTSDRLKLIERIKTEEPARPRSLDGRIPRDLETIVLKAIDKDPQRRYATAEAMAEDLRRFLDDEPIQARRASAAERYARWARHHPGIAVLGAVLTAVLVLTTVASLFVAERMATPGPGRAEVTSGRPGRDLPRRPQRGQGAAGRASARLARRGPGRPRTTRRHADAQPRPARAAHRGRGHPRDTRHPPRGQDCPARRDLGSFTFSPDGRTLLTADARRASTSGTCRRTVTCLPWRA